MTKSGFGEHLKREREMRGVTLDEICAATRIGNRFLEALESEEWERLPGGVFNRGFVRAVARYLGLDEEALVAEYLLATTEQNPTPEWAKPQPPLPPETRWPRWIGIALALLLIAAGALGWRVYATRRAERRASAIAAELAAQPADEDFGTAPGRPAAPEISDLNNFTPPIEPPPATPALNRLDADALQLKVEAGKGTSITVSADGSKVFEGSMIPGQSRQFGAQIDFEVQAQDAGAVLLELNGQTLAPMGPPGRSGMVVLTHDDLKSTGGRH
jgi:cytoskeleton protein RodZ